MIWEARKSVSCLDEFIISHPKLEGHSISSLIIFLLVFFYLFLDHNLYSYFSFFVVVV